MDTKNLASKIMETVKHLLGDEYIVSTNKVTKNNGLILTGLTIGRKGYNIASTIYINGFFDLYNAGIPISAIADKIVRVYEENAVSQQFDISFIDDFNATRNKIIFQLVNTERNAALLESIPSVPFLDLSIIFKIYHYNNSLGAATTTITNKLMASWKVDTDTIYEAAMANTPVLQEYTLCSMSDVLAELMPEIDIQGTMADIDMFVLTNKEKFCGCGCILYPHVLDDFACKVMDTDFFILPSSRHETILTSALKKDADMLRQMVKEINATNVSQEDFLSDNIYYYSKETKKITMIQ